MTATPHQAKQAISSLEYISKSIKTVQNDIEALYSKEHISTPIFIPLESDLLLKRVKDGGHSGEFLAHAFISSYRTHTPFQHSLGEIMKLDKEAIRLFHQILHIRFIKGWSDDVLYDLEQEIIALNEVVK